MDINEKILIIFTFISTIEVYLQQYMDECYKEGVFMKDFDTNAKPGNEEDEEMMVELDLDDGSQVVCAVITIRECRKKDYIVLLPLDENGENNDGEVWFYRYYEDENDTNAEPVLEYIEDDEEYEMVAEAFDEYLDNEEFDELMDES